MKKTRTILSLALSGVLIICVLCFSGLLDKQKIWPIVPMEYTNASAEWSLERGDQYGIVSSGPYFQLPAGEYKIKWRIEGDGVNRIHLTSDNHVQITPSYIETTPELTEQEAIFVIHETARDFGIETEFCSGTRLRIQNFRMYSPFYTDLYFTLAIAVLSACVLLFAAQRGWMTQERIHTFFILGTMVLLTSRLYLQDNSPCGWDTAFHAQRILNLADGLKSGQFPVIVGGFSYNGYGAMTSVFYGDMLLYPWALMHIAGVSMSYILNTLAIAVNACAACSMYIAVKGLTRDKASAVCSSLLFLGSAHWLTALYRRFALGEMFGMAFLPLFLFALYELIFGDRKHWALLAFSSMLIFRSHFLTTAFCLVIAVAMCLLFLKRIISEKRLTAILYAILFAVLLNLNQLVPFVMNYLNGVNTSVFPFNFTEYTYLPSHVLDIRLGIGFTLVIGTVSYICIRSQLENQREKFVGDLCLVGGWLFTLMTTDLIPWSYVEVLAGGILAILQFPARFLIPGAVMLAICGGIGMRRVFKDNPLSAMLLTLVISVAFFVPYAESVIGMPSLEYGQTYHPFMSFPEYQIEGTDVEDTNDTQPIISGNMELTKYEKKGTKIIAHVKAHEESEIVFPLFGFDGYAVQLNGKQIDWFRGKNNCLAIHVPAETNGELVIWYAGKTIWRAADIITFSALFALIVYGIKKRRMLPV